MEKVTVTASRTYDILIGDGLIDQVGPLMAERFDRCRAAILTDDRVALLYARRVAASLDRTSERPFSESEVEILELVTAQLANLYKNFFTDPATIPGVSRNIDDATLDALLTKREREVVKLLCQGLSPTTISTTLNISLSTAYKHIAHIYKKLHVSSQQELLVRVLRAR